MSAIADHPTCEITAMSNATPNILIHKSHPAGRPVVVGCPFDADTVSEDVSAMMVNASGTSIPAQTSPLTPRTPAGARWVELSLLATAPGEASVTPSDNHEGEPIARADDKAITLDNGILRVTLDASANAAPIHIDYAEREGFGELTPEVLLANNDLRHDLGREPRTINLLRNGPIRAQAELSGVLTSPDGEPALSYRLTVELWRGRSALRIDWMLAHLVPGKTHLNVHRATLHGAWKVGNETKRRFMQNNYSEFYVSRQVDNADRVEIAVDQTMGPVHVTDPAMLTDDCDYAHYLAPPLVGVQPWLGLVGEDAAVYASIHDFTAMRPTSLESNNTSLDFHFLPEGDPVRWPQGRRREQTLLLGFAQADDEQKDAIRQMEESYPLGIALPTAQTLAQHRCFDLDRTMPYIPGRNVRFTALLDRLCNLKTSGDKWNLGDTPDAGYTHTYAPIPNCFRMLPGAPDLPRRFNPTGNALLRGIESAFQEPVWANNEYDAIHAIALEVMRTGKDDHFNMLRWTARHNIEVDFLAYNDDRWHHRGVPFHSHYHNTKGVISSHLWTQGLLEYYCLTGDRDALEVSHAMGEKIIEIDHDENARQWKFDRELGWALLAMVCLVESGFEQYRKECDAVGRWLLDYDRTKFAGMVNLSGTKPGRSLERQMVDSGFGYSSMVEAMDRWQHVTESDEAAAWMQTLCAQLMDETWNAIGEGEIPGITRMVSMVMAIGYERTGDERYIQTGLVMLEHFLDQVGAGQFNFGEVKPIAMAYRGLYRFLYHANELDLLEQYEYPALVAGLKRRQAQQQ